MLASARLRLSWRAGGHPEHPEHPDHPGCASADLSVWKRGTRIEKSDLASSPRFPSSQPASFFRKLPLILRILAVRTWAKGASHVHTKTSLGSLLTSCWIPSVGDVSRLMLPPSMPGLYPRNGQGESINSSLASSARGIVDPGQQWLVKHKRAASQFDQRK